MAHFIQSTLCRASSRLFGACILFVCALCGALAPAHAATITVTNTDDSGSGSLRAAIVAANATPAIADTIAFSINATNFYEVSLTSPLPNISSDITFQGEGREVTGIARNINAGYFRIFYIEAGHTVEFKQLLIYRGNSNGLFTSGGGVYNAGSVVTITDCWLSGNHSNSGGAIFNPSGGHLIVKNSRISANEANYGGGIYNEGTLDINDSLIASNFALTFPFERSTERDYNGGLFAKGGGAVYTIGGNVSINRSVLSFNAGEFGGAIYQIGGTLGILASAVYGNYCTTSGQIIQTVEGTLNLSNSVLSNGSSEKEASAAGIGIFGSTVDITSCTIKGQEREYDDENVSILVSENGSLSLQNSIVACASQKDIYKVSGSVINKGHNIIGRNTSVETEFPEGVPSGTSFVGIAASPYDPKVGVIPSGNSARYAPLLVGSAAIDAGDTDLTADMRGVTRPQGTADDIGSYEFSNYAPELSDIAITPDENTLFTFAASYFEAGFTDADDDTLQTVKIVSLPSHGVLKLNNIAVTAGQEIAANEIGNLTYLASLNYHSTDSFNWNGSDGSEYAATSALVEITVNEVNDDPTLDEIPTINSDEGVLITIFAHGEDVDTGTVLEYSLIDAPTGATINSATGEFKWAPTEAQGPQSYTFQIKVVDGEGGQATRDVTINVSEVNAAPVLPFVGARTLTYGDNTTFNFAATDAELPRNTLAYSLIGAPAGAS